MSDARHIAEVCAVQFLAVVILCGGWNFFKMSRQSAKRKSPKSKLPKSAGKALQDSEIADEPSSQTDERSMKIGGGAVALMGSAALVFTLLLFSRNLFLSGAGGVHIHKNGDHHPYHSVNHTKLRQQHQALEDQKRQQEVIETEFQKSEAEEPSSWSAGLGLFSSASSSEHENVGGINIQQLQAVVKAKVLDSLEPLIQSTVQSAVRSTVQSAVQSGLEKAMLQLSPRLASGGTASSSATSKRTLNGSPQSPWFVSVLGVQFDKDLLPHVIGHYMAQGVTRDRFLLTLHHNNPNCLTNAECKKEFDYYTQYFEKVGIPLHADHWLGDFSSMGQKVRKDALMARFVAADDWVIDADSDCLHEFPYKNAPAFLDMVAASGFDAVYGRYLDRVHKHGEFPKATGEYPGIFEQFPLVCNVSVALIGASNGLKVVAYRGYHRANTGVGKVEDEHKACLFPGLLSINHFKFRHQVAEKLATRRAITKEKRHLDRGGGAQDDRFMDYLHSHNNRINVHEEKLECYNAATAKKPLLWAHAPAICPKKIKAASEYTSGEERKRGDCERVKLGNYSYCQPITLKPVPKHSRVALCVTGPFMDEYVRESQLNSLHKHLMPSIASCVRCGSGLPQPKIDVYLHLQLWQYNGMGHMIPTLQKLIDRVRPVDLEIQEDAGSTADRACFGAGDIGASSHACCEPQIWKTNNDTDREKLFEYSWISRCFRRTRQLELKYKVSYEWVVRTRLDLVFFQPLPWRGFRWMYHLASKGLALFRGTNKDDALDAFFVLPCGGDEYPNRCTLFPEKLANAYEEYCKSSWWLPRLPLDTIFLEAMKKIGVNEENQLKAEIPAARTFYKSGYQGDCNPLNMRKHENDFKVSLDHTKKQPLGIVIKADSLCIDMLDDDKKGNSSLLNEYNHRNPMKPVIRGDCIVEVNGAVGDHPILKEMHRKKLLNLTFTRESYKDVCKNHEGFFSG